MERLRELGLKLTATLKLKSLPVGVSYLKEGNEPPSGARRPGDRGMRATLCQAMTWARIYGWTVAMGRRDNLCIPGGLAVNLLKSTRFSNSQVLSRFMVEVGWVSPEKAEEQEWHTLDLEYHTLLLEPLTKAQREPQLVVIYGDPSQIVKLIHGYSYSTGKGVIAKTSGRVACSDYLVAPLTSRTPIVTIPGTGDRVFSGTQDHEMVLAMPFHLLETTAHGLEKAGAQVGSNRYPFVPYMLHQVKFPPIYEKLAREMEVSI